MCMNVVKYMGCALMSRQTDISLVTPLTLDKQIIHCMYHIRLSSLMTDYYGASSVDAVPLLRLIQLSLDSLIAAVAMELPLNENGGEVNHARRSSIFYRNLCQVFMKPVYVTNFYAHVGKNKSVK